MTQPQTKPVQSLSASAPKKLSATLATPKAQIAIKTALGDPNAARKFCAALCAAASQNPELHTCDHMTVIAAALVGTALKLSPSPTFGQFYMVPFWDNKRKRRAATFILGYKGYIQLALRSGHYRRLNVIAVKEGELVRWDPFTEDVQLSLIEDEDQRDATPTAGYVAMFEYMNGFRKTIYWTRAKMMLHADRYSKAFNVADYDRILRGEIPEDEMWRYSSFWYKDFDGMAKKTMLRQLIGKWGVMSVDMETAFSRDNTFSDAYDGEIGGYGPDSTDTASEPIQSAPEDGAPADAPQEAEAAPEEAPAAGQAAPDAPADELEDVL